MALGAALGPLSWPLAHDFEWVRRVIPIERGERISMRHRSSGYPRGPRGYNRYFGGPRGPGVVRNRVNLSFLSTALDPQADVILSQNYEGFMPIFRFNTNRIFGKKW